MASLRFIAASLRSKFNGKLGLERGRPGDRTVRLSTPERFDDPDTAVAVVGAACRLPCAPTPESFWAMLDSGRHGIVEVPRGGWDRTAQHVLDSSANGGMNVRYAGLLERVDLFDAGFFGISPREAATMDPQQRLTLELSWEALEDAGIVPADLAETRSAVFVGAFANDYELLVHRSAPSQITSHTLTGLNRGMIANRVSFTLKLRGPSLTVDAAQASSLVAVQMACESLRRGDASLALAGGVHLMLAPESMEVLREFGALSPDGRCFAFDARANGFVCGEGGGILVLKTLRRAWQDGDRVDCVILGGAINNDGGGDGLTVPSPSAQTDLLVSAYRNARMDPAEVQYVELHGTGTRVGDPVEAEALGAALTRNRRADDPLRVGAAKTNVGHLGAAAGVVGALKVALALRARRLPPSLNYETPNPAIDLERLRLEVRTTSGAWPHPERRLTAGVSSFGMGGTNCHLVMAEAPAPPIRSLVSVPEATCQPPPAYLPWVFSARSQAALNAQARQLGAFVAGSPEIDHVTIGAALVRTRATFEHRAVIVGRGRATYIESLRATEEGRPLANVVIGRAATPGKVAFVLPGQGHQWRGMATDLLESSRVFRDCLIACDRSLSAYLDWSVLQVLEGKPGSPDLERSDVVQPVLFALMVSLAELWASFGVRPGAVVGHSQGEVAAACVAGHLSLGAAARVIASRSQLATRLDGHGGLLSLQLGADDVRRRVARWHGRLTVGAVNSPRATIVSGETGALDELLAEMTNEGVVARRLPVRYASHSAFVEPIRAPFLEALADLQPSNGAVPLYSTVTGEPLLGSRMDASYWYRNLRETVEFDRAVRALVADGCRTFIELGAHPVLSMAVQETLGDIGTGTEDIRVIGTMRRDRPGWESFLLAAADAYAKGVDVDWSAAFPGRSGRGISLPSYPFQRTRHWFGQAATASAKAPELLRGGPACRTPHEPAAMEQSPGTPILNVAELVRAHISIVLGHGDSAEVDLDRDFKALGFNSLTGVELRNRLANATGRDLPAQLVYDSPTPRALIQYLGDVIAGAEEDTARPLAEHTFDERKIDDAIAIVSTACRLPGGVRIPEDLWRIVADGIDASTEAPDGRSWLLDDWYDPESKRPGTSYTCRGGFLEAPDGFDSDFFGISPREALAIEPQQRLLLELAWEAFERAGIPCDRFRGTETGVFVGMMASEYGPRLHDDNGELGGYLLTGTSPSVASGRIAFTFGLDGPALTVDTACSSSLVAIQLACESLRRGECRAALAGGATVMATPGVFIEFSRQGGLARDGRCKAFGASADGTAWGEGGGLLLLERLRDARALGHPVLALIRGGAINHGSGNGLAAPSRAAQEAVIRKALVAARLKPEDIDVVEAHGTGTKLGDPIEAAALMATYGRERQSARPLQLGSLKSNIGHTQAAAGVAGVIKMVEALRHGVLPRTLHVEQATPHVDWSRGAVALLKEPLPWPTGECPRRAAVSSFGISGTNAHLIIEEAPVIACSTEARSPATFNESQPAPFVLSAASATALAAQATRLVDHLVEHPELPLLAVGHALGAGRTHHRLRTAIPAADRTTLLAGLREVGAGKIPTDAPQGRARRGGGSDAGPGVVFVFPGQGSQWPGMGAALMAASPIAAAHLRACAAILDPMTGWSLLDLLNGRAGGPDMARADVVQPALFAMMTAIAAHLRAVGLHPDAVVGHSQGEIAAAFVAGALALEDAVRIVALRSRALVAIRGKGGMLSLAAGVAATTALLESWQGRVGIAALNGPTSTVVSGDAAALEELHATCERQGLRVNRISVDYASHGNHVDVICDDIRRALEGIAARHAEVPFYSTFTGGQLNTTRVDAEYWYSSLRHPVRYEQATRALLADGLRLFVEIAPHPVLTVPTQETIDTVGADATIIGSLRRDDGGAARLTNTVSEAYCLGASLDWDVLFPNAPDLADPLPTYPFDHGSYWMPPNRSRSAQRAKGEMGPGVRPMEHPILGTSVELSDGGTLVMGRISRALHSWISDHAVRGQVIVPGALWVELATHAASCFGDVQIEELTLNEPLVVPHDGEAVLQVRVDGPNSRGRRHFEIHARCECGTGEARNPGDGLRWTRHASGFLSDTGVGASVEANGRTESDSVATWPPLDAEPVSTSGAYERLARRGYEYGACFRRITRLWRSSGRFYAEVELGARLPSASGFRLHPALLDAALHPLLMCGVSDDELLLPFSWERVHCTGHTSDLVRVEVTPSGPSAAALRISSPEGHEILSVGCITLRPPAGGSMDPTATRHRSLFRLAWLPLPLPSSPRRNQSNEVGKVVRVGAKDIEVLGGATWYPDLATLRKAVAAGSPKPATIVFGATDLAAANLDESATDLPRRTREAVRAALGSLQTWLRESEGDATRLVFVTRHAEAVLPGDPSPDPAIAAATGLVRSAQSENPGRIFLVDVDVGTVSTELLAAALGSGDTRLAVRDGTLHHPRLTPWQSDEALLLPDAGDFCVQLTGRGSLGRIGVVPNAAAARRLAPHEARVAVRAAGLNFHDVVLALDMIDEAGGIGVEGSGVVLDVGDAVTRVKPGDRVMGLFDNAFAPRAVADERKLMPIPQGWSFAAAAAFPVAWLTACYGLIRLGGLARGEKVLIHAATGGVGRAAVQLARIRGAEVFVTASKQKWPILAAQGFDAAHIADSRTCEFESKFSGVKRAGGFDVVLGSLAGEQVDASLRLLRSGGRYVEMGKTDVRNPAAIGVEYPGVSYAAFDLLVDLDPNRIAAMFEDLVTLLSTEHLTPLPLTCFDVRHARLAYRHLSKARHSGKIVLTIPRRLDPNGTVLITGGTGTLGALVARRLTEAHGIRHLVLACRRGENTKRARELVAALSDLGADVRVVACDAAERSDLEALLADIQAEHPLTAVVHAAGVLDDGIIGSLSPDRVDTVLRPKVDGASHLHELTSGCDLAAFVLFSSIAGTVGNPGQGSYAAANAFLDALGRQRHRDGLPATTTVWGLWGPVGGMTGHLGATDLTRLTRAGILALDAAEGLDLFDLCLGLEEAVAFPVRVDGAALHGLGENATPVLRGLATAPTSRSETPRAVTGFSLPEGVPVGEKLRLLVELIRTEASVVLGRRGMGAVPSTRPFKELGFDSLTAVELRNRLHAATGCRLPATLIFDHPTPAALAHRLLDELVEPSGQPSATGTPRSNQAQASDRNRKATEDRRAVTPFADRLAHADAEEVFDLIDRELGLAPT